MEMQIEAPIEQLDVIEKAGWNAVPATPPPAETKLKSSVQPSLITRIAKGRLFTMRGAQPGDAASIAAIGSASFAAAHRMALPPETLQELVASTWSEQQVAELITNPAVQYFVAQTAKAIVGTVSLNPLYQPDYLRQFAAVEFARFYLRRDWIGYGVGAALMSYALHQAAITGYSHIWLRVWQGNERAIQFYEQWGFQTIALDTYDVGDTPVPVLSMMRSLNVDGGPTSLPHP